MKKLGHLGDMKLIDNLPKEVKITVKDILTILDTEYGADRDIDSDNGGYVVIIEDILDYIKLKEFNIDLEEMIPEYVDGIVIENNVDYINAMLLCSNDYSISIICPLSIAPQNLIDYIE